ncbi:D-alanyl-D-alanine carboxypeptidase family protein [Aureimonas altamirensis]|jgi:D-alanyl-D-alanine carboxypeptidase|uniref:D-alanyl-D-alanine carboxypeptidase n=1 Tax=Aureimonas altamirensis DSM 21988 TaxID=1121026 RepID=A0ABY1IMR9_9HYPH|nr:D-alanyl-D-alanine carboxypeptidase family protein [Aureimonas altamirensis]SHJ49943.1 D-alanyl-D-alanine carboxypeptidase [Aureimonas altamirensis DSM 21988]
MFHPRLTRSLRRVALIASLALALAACRSGDVLTVSSPPPATMPTTGVMAAVQERGQSELVLDASTGRILYQENANELRYPASLTKLMTLYLLFEAVESGRLTLESPLTVSAEAASRPPAKLGLPVGTSITVREAATALAVRSANDVAVVVAEGVAGSEEAFARQMNARARAIGMSRTHFVNASGLPDEGQISTARDMALLALQLRTRFPAYQNFFTLKEFRFNGRRYEATNKLLGKVPGVDGLKTGYIRASGFHLVATAQRGNKRLIAVVMGGETGRARDARAEQLLETWF